MDTIKKWNDRNSNNPDYQGKSTPTGAIFIAAKEPYQGKVEILFDQMAF